MDLIHPTISQPSRSIQGRLWLSFMSKERNYLEGRVGLDYVSLRDSQQAGRHNNRAINSICDRLSYVEVANHFDKEKCKAGQKSLPITSAPSNTLNNKA